MRRGITLMEVLVAMGVMLLGLAGVFSLMPVAKFYLSDGAKYDATSVLGHKAIHELEIRRELLDPENWYAPAGNGQFLQVCPDNPAFWPTGISLPGGTATYNYQWFNLSPVATIPAAPFCFDPMGCVYPSNLAQNGSGGATSPSGQINVAGAYGPTFFPPSGYSLDGVGSPGSPAMTRITVPRSGGIAMSSTLGFAVPMAFNQAAKIFQSSDELLFLRPDDGELRPTLPTVSATEPWRYTTSQGDYSWFAIVDNRRRPWSPGGDSAWGDVTSDDNSDGIFNDISEAGWPGSDDIALWKTSGGETWHVSVVVVHKRNLQLIPSTSAEVPPERMVYCDFLSAPLPASSQNLANAGLGGGDCLLCVPSTIAAGPEWLDVKVNQWIMVSAWPNLQSDITLPPIRGQLPITQWLRISAAGDIVKNATGWERGVTLTGADWNPYKFVDAIGAPAGNQSSYATIVDGVTGVFEMDIEQGQ